MNKDLYKKAPDSLVKALISLSDEYKIAVGDKVDRALPPCNDAKVGICFLCGPKKIGEMAVLIYLLDSVDIYSPQKEEYVNKILYVANNLNITKDDLSTLMPFKDSVLQAVASVNKSMNG